MTNHPSVMAYHDVLTGNMNVTTLCPQNTAYFYHCGRDMFITMCFHAYHTGAMF